MKKVLLSSGWRHERIPDEPAYKLVYKGSGGTWDIIIFADEEKGAMSFICPQIFKYDEDDPDVLKIINDINSNVLMGKLIYMEDRKTISAVVTIPCEPKQVSSQTVLRTLRILIAIIEHVSPYILGSHQDRGRQQTASKHPFPLPDSDPADMN